MTDKWFRVVRVQGQGYGTMTPEAWDAMPEAFRARVRVLELCDSQEGATTALRVLSQSGKWRDKGDIHEAHGQWWENTGVVADGMRLHMPADVPLPVVELTHAEKFALAWRATQPQILAPR